ncbi:purine/pyrimidine permease [Burkholderiaceae bacterium FT117]|uniref:solute carrier family 23 protein n=1 Tax=Zeimonas sediminis TaxID=2944268 RepID=UPI0023430B04|nr:solute carrier family 23 protein [Zeimonas sediminis]MCM5570421.1 purine/pyrimidine permease [Zeimonas sediminis]
MPEPKAPGGVREAGTGDAAGPGPAGRFLRRLLRKPGLAAHLEAELARLGPGHAVTDPGGQVVVGDRGELAAECHEVSAGGRLVARVHGPRSGELAGLLRVLAAQDDEAGALARESLDRYKEVTMLYSLSEKIIGATDPGEVAQVLCEEVARFLRCDSTTVLLLNPETNRLETVAGRGDPFHDRATRDIEDDIIASVLRSGVGEIVNDVSADSRSLAARNVLQSIVCSPLRSHDRVFGVLVAGMRARREFSAGELQAVNSMAAHAAAAIEAARLDRALKSTSAKPVDLIYAVDDRPPGGIALLLAFQHVLIAVMSLAYPVLVTLEAGGSRATAASVVSMSLVAMAFATVLQSLRSRWVGSGFLAPYVTSAIYLGPSLLAARLGGLGLVFGMTIFAGLATLVLSQLVRRFRKLFPPEVSGVVVLMVGLSIVPVALPQVFGAGDGGPVGRPASIAVGALTLGTIVLLSVLPFRRIRLYATAAGMGLGYLAGAAAGMLDETAVQRVGEVPLFGVHALPAEALRFDLALAMAFVAAVLASVVKDAGLVTSCQKTNDARWKRLDVRSTSGGIVASGLGNLAAGTLGGAGVGISGGSVGLAAATGATARTIGLVVAGMFLALAFMPKVTTLLSMMPAPVMGAGLLFVACHLVSSGAELITSRMLDARRNYVVGLPLLAGVGMMVMPGIAADAPAWAVTVMGSPLAISTILALGLNLVLNAGVSSRARLELSVDAATRDRISRFFERQGASWGARGDVIHRAAPAVTEWCEEVAIVSGATRLRVELQFDEFRLSVVVRDARADADLVGVQPLETSASLERVLRTIERRYECKARILDSRSVGLEFEH